jgi:glucose-6-phosphate isomerase
LNAKELWARYREEFCECPGLGISLDVSRMFFDEGFWGRMEPAMQRAYEAMKELEAGAVANPDEGRMVGHYWLRRAELAPSEALRREIAGTIERVMDFAGKVHGKEVKPAGQAKFTDLLSIGIGGSALGPELVADALGSKSDKLKVHFLDNTDPDGIARVLKTIGARLKSTLVLVISKSGGTAETRNGMLEVQAAFARAGLTFAKQAVAITGEGSQLDQTAEREGWLARFPMWDWVGGRTSVTSAVGLLPAALQGLDVKGFLDGAAKMDELTRRAETRTNPAARLALMWHVATEGKGEKDMVVLPYKDRLILLSRYLQQLVMESLGKKLDLDGNEVYQGIAVYGNKGSTDQHAYVQQLRDGLNNFFVTFIVVKQDLVRPVGDALEVEEGVTTGDYLSGFWQGTRKALYESGRGSITIAVEKLDAKALGAMVALYERAVGFYAAMVNVNAYHQPGVEAGKKAAGEVLAVQKKVIGYVKEHGEEVRTAEEVAEGIGEAEQVETVYHVLEHLAANRRYVKKVRGRYGRLEGK